MKSLSDYIKVYDDVFDKPTCNELIRLFDQETPLTSPYVRKSDFKWEQDYRCFNEMDITKVESFKPFLPMYYTRVKQVCEHYKLSIDSSFFPTKLVFEDARLKKYEANDYDQFGWHTDVGDKPSASRYLVMFTYLNDVEEGGETEFQSNFEFTVKPVCGRMVVFPPMWMFPHRGKKPVSGPKYILSTYLHYA
jgi:prolyl 4-hydroxylase